MSNTKQITKSFYEHLRFDRYVIAFYHVNLTLEYFVVNQLLYKTHE